MAHRKYQIACVLIVAALVPFTGCKSAQAPAPAASAPAGKTPPSAPEPPPCHHCTLVSAGNFSRAESDMYFGGTVKNGSFGKFTHNRGVMPIDEQAVIRANRDTLYSAAVFDLDAGPVTITLPDAGKRFMSMMVIDEDQYVPLVAYGAGTHSLTKKQIGTRYAMVGVRTFVDPADPKDLEKVHALQDAIKVIQASPGSFDVPKWDQASQKKERVSLS